jgi:Zn-finger nucleic acid-binding protein
MNCPNCGAPMKLFRERDYYHCEHCQSYHFPNRDQDGLRILGKNPEGIPCPHCQEVLNLITFDDFFQGYQCATCLGLLFNRTTFREAIDYHRSRTKSPPEPFSQYHPDELDRVTYCPICREQMDTFQYNGPGNIVIDTCHTCDLIWLDYGELKKVINAPGKDRGVPRPKPPDEDEKERRDAEEQITFKDLISVFLDEFF